MIGRFVPIVPWDSLQIDCVLDKRYRKQSNKPVPVHKVGIDKVERPAPGPELNATELKTRPHDPDISDHTFPQPLK